MTLLSDPPRGGTYETVGGERRLLMLRMGEIERFEDKHIGIFAAWEKMLTSELSVSETLDLIALALVGGGLTDKEAEALMAEQTPDALFQLRETAGAILAAAMMPDEDFRADEDEDESEPSSEKKKKQSASIFGKLFGARRRRDGVRQKSAA